MANSIKATAHLSVVLLLMICLSHQDAKAQPSNRAEPAQATSSQPGANQALRHAFQLEKEAMESFRQGDSEDALKRLQESLQLAPERQSANTNMGLILGKTGRPSEAIPFLEKAVKINPDIPQPWLNLGTFAISAGDLDKGIAAHKEYLRRFPRHPSSAGVRHNLVSLEKLLQARKSNLPSTNYLDESIADAGTFLWRSQYLPLKIFVAPAEDNEEADYVPEEILKESLEEWTTASGGKLKFSLVERKDNPVIICKWTNSAERMQHSSEKGDCHRLMRDGDIYLADITFLTVDTNGKPLSKTEMKSLTLHEIGHALGLGHSSDPKDIMFMSQTFPSEMPSLSPRDKATLLELYSGKFKTPGELRESGLALIDKGHFEEAAQTFTKMHEQCQKCRPALILKASAYFDLSMHLLDKGNQSQSESALFQSLAVLKEADSLSSASELTTDYLSRIKRLNPKISERALEQRIKGYIKALERQVETR